MALLDGKVAIVTGAGRGIGREEALLLAKQGAKVVVNDLGGHFDGTGQSRSPAEDVIKEIRSFGGEAVANFESVSDFKSSKRIIECALDNFGKLNIVVNNAGILRDRMIFNMSVDEFDAVIRVHLRGTWCMSHHAAVYWREKSKDGTVVDARIVNTTSPTGLYGNMGQTNYGAAKAGIANMTIITAQELARYGAWPSRGALGRTRTKTSAGIRRSLGQWYAVWSRKWRGSVPSASPLLEVDRAVTLSLLSRRGEWAVFWGRTPARW
jgi:NAD(P)-dependent dehydrogenase (short-subunit alcohol dehydrogenase family)